MIRVFVGFFTTKQIYEQVENLSKDWSSYINGSWVKPQNLHMTFHFIGEIQEGLLIDIMKAMQEVSKRQKPIEISYKSLGVFPNLDRARVLWIGVSDGYHRLKALANDIVKVNLRVGIKSEGKPFHPHVTVCRIKEFDKRKLKDLIRQYENTTFGVDKVDRVSIVKSSLTQVGPVYTIIEEFYFGR